jgi:hypothetical protein
MNTIRLTESGLRRMIKESVEDLMKGNPWRKDPLGDYPSPTKEELEDLCKRTFSNMTGEEVFQFLYGHNLMNTDLETVGLYLRDFYYSE